MSIVGKQIRVHVGEGWTETEGQQRGQTKHQQGVGAKGVIKVASIGGREDDRRTEEGDKGKKVGYLCEVKGGLVSGAIAEYDS